MFLDSVQLTNFRKFGGNNNIVRFADASNYDVSSEDTINIASKTTLVVGKNNCGKTTIIDALDTLMNSDRKFKATDFNFNYLHSLLDLYRKDKDKISNNLPNISIKITISLENKKDEDIYSSLYPILTIDDITNKKTSILIKYVIKEDKLFVNTIAELLKQDFTSKEQLLFDKFLQIINNTEFKTKYFNSNDDEVKAFNLSNIIELKYIRANNIREEKCLTRAFAKLVEYRNKSEEGTDAELNTKIDNINISLTKQLDDKHTKSINDVLKNIIDDKKCKVKLKSDLTVDELLLNVVHYYFDERDVFVPENQFGLGYTNLIMIIAEILNYIEKYPTNKYNDHINLIAIEEPETFMHPQMQELFIKHINDILYEILKEKNKNINSQLIITTHSARILNSKIGEGCTFNNINYMREEKGYACVIPLRDENIAKFSTIEKNRIEALIKDNKKEELNEIDSYCKFEFIKKHIKFNISEIFFSDAIIFVEGPSEYVLLKYYIEKLSSLRYKYISVVLISGAYAQMYGNLLDVLNIPTLIITDIDIKREEDEKEKFIQITSLQGRTTTNSTIKKYNETESLDNCDYIKKNNLIITYQKDSINNYYPTSFEEAFILTNSHSNDLVNILKEIHKIKFKENGGKQGLIDNSFKWQETLLKDKTRFANKILYKEIIKTGTDNLFELPKYIMDGFKFLEGKLNEEQ